MSLAAQRLYGASNAYPTCIIEYAPDPARPVRSLMADIGARLTGRRGGTYPAGPGTPETSFTGYAPEAPSSVVYATQPGLTGAGRPYADHSATMSSSVSGGPTSSLAMAMFAERLRRQGVAL